MNHLRTLFLVCLLWVTPWGGNTQKVFDLDTTFQVDMDGEMEWYYKYVGDYHVNPDGSIIMVGSFKHWLHDYMPREIVKLFPDGGLDHSFSYPVGYPDPINFPSRIVDDSNSYLIGHHGYPGVNRISQDGSIDTTFQFPLDTFWNENVTVADIHIAPYHNILVSGYFMLNPGIGWGILRLKQDGNIDTTFHCTLVDKSIYRFHVLKDGKILVVGSKSDLNLRRQGLWRIQSNGLLDTTFKTDIVAGYCTYLVVLENGRILVKGRFYLDGKPEMIELARFLSDGSLDTSFNYQNDFGKGLGAVLPLEKLILVGGTFQHINGHKYNCIGVLDTNGNLDTSFFGGSFGPDSSNFYVYPGTDYFKMQGDKIIIDGSFHSFNGHQSFQLVRLFGLTVGVKETADMYELSMYPNPTEGWVFLSSNFPIGGRVELFDINGQIISCKQLVGLQNTHNLNLPNLPNGIYFLRFIDRNGYQYCKRLILSNVH